MLMAAVEGQGAGLRNEEPDSQPPQKNSEDTSPSPAFPNECMIKQISSFSLLIIK